MRTTAINKMHALLERAEKVKERKANDPMSWDPARRKRKIIELIAKFLSGMSAQEREDLEIAIVEAGNDTEIK